MTDPVPEVPPPTETSRHGKYTIPEAPPRDFQVFNNGFWTAIDFEKLRIGDIFRFADPGRNPSGAFCAMTDASQDCGQWSLQADPAPIPTPEVLDALVSPPPAAPQEAADLAARMVAVHAGMTAPKPIEVGTFDRTYPGMRRWMGPPLLDSADDVAALCGAMALELPRSATLRVGLHGTIDFCFFKVLPTEIIGHVARARFADVGPVHGVSVAVVGNDTDCEPGDPDRERFGVILHAPPADDAEPSAGDVADALPTGLAGLAARGHEPTTEPVDWQARAIAAERLAHGAQSEVRRGRDAVARLEKQLEAAEHRAHDAEDTVDRLGRYLDDAKQSRDAAIHELHEVGHALYLLGSAPDATAYEALCQILPPDRLLDLRRVEEALAAAEVARVRCRRGSADALADAIAAHASAVARLTEAEKAAEATP